jgi:hypothetical protein
VGIQQSDLHTHYTVVRILANGTTTIDVGTEERPAPAGQEKGTRTGWIQDLVFTIRTLSPRFLTCRAESRGSVSLPGQMSIHAV